MVDEESDKALIEGGHRAEQSSHYVQTFLKEKFVSLTSLVQFVDRIYEEAPAKVFRAYVGQNFAECTTWHSMNFTVSEQVKDAVK